MRENPLSDLPSDRIHEQLPTPSAEEKIPTPSPATNKCMLDSCRSSDPKRILIREKLRKVVSIVNFLCVFDCSLPSELARKCHPDLRPKRR